MKYVALSSIASEMSPLVSLQFPQVKPDVTSNDKFCAIPNSEYDPALRPRLQAPTPTGGRVPLDASTLPFVLANGSPPARDPVLFSLADLSQPIERPQATWL
jgi:hypothetical protein